MQPTRTEFVDPPERGRIFRTERRVSIDDADPAGHMQLDAVARFLQDAGNDDTDDAGLPRLGLAWVARRLAVRIDRPPRSRELLSISTWCSGTGRRWAERRTRLVGADGGRIEAAALWVHVDVTTGRPVAWGDEFAQHYLEAAAGREIDARLRHPKVPDAERGVHTLPWRFRESDMDAFGHANNTSYLAALEEIGVRPDGDGPLEVEVEWRVPAVAGEDLTVRWQDGDGSTLVWLGHGSDGAELSDLRATFAVRRLRD